MITNCYRPLHDSLFSVIPNRMSIVGIHLNIPTYIATFTKRQFTGSPQVTVFITNEPPSKFHNCILVTADNCTFSDNCHTIHNNTPSFGNYYTRFELLKSWTATITNEYAFSQGLLQNQLPSFHFAYSKVSCHPYRHINSLLKRKVAEIEYQ